MKQELHLFSFMITMLKIFSILSFLVPLIYSATVVEELNLREAKKIEGIGNAGKREDNFKKIGRKLFMESDILTPLKAVYLMEEKLARTGDWNLKNIYLNEDRRNIENTFAKRSQIMSNNDNRKLNKRSALVVSDILPDIDIDTRIYGNERSISQFPLHKIHVMKKRSEPLLKESDINLFKSQEIFEKNLDELEMRDIDIDLLKTENEVDQTKFFKTAETNKEMPIILKDGLISTNGYKGVDLATLKKEIDSNLANSVELSENNGRISGIFKNKLIDADVRKDIDVDLLQKEIDEDLTKLHAISKRETDILQGMEKERTENEQKNIDFDFIKRYREESNHEMTKNYFKILKTHSENQNEKDFFSLTKSKTYKQFSEKKIVKNNVRKYHHNHQGQTGSINPTNEGQTMTQGLDGGQNKIKTKNERDFVDLRDKSQISKEDVERDGNLLSLGNPLPPVGVQLGLQTGSRNLKHPVATKQSLPLVSKKTGDLSGAQNTLRSFNQNNLKDFNTEPLNKDLERDGTLLSIGNPLPSVGLLLGLQTGREFSEIPREFNGDRSVNEQIERDGDLLTVGNPLPSVGAQLGLQVGKSLDY